MAAAPKRAAGAPGLATNPSTSPATQHAHDRLCLLLLVLVGQSVVATLKGGVRVRGILSAATTDGEVSIALRQAVYLSPPADSQAPKSSLIINARDLLELEATDVVLDPPSLANSVSAGSGPAANKDSFRTDTDISGLPPPSRPRERDLQAWSAGAEAWGGGAGKGSGLGGIEDSASNGFADSSLEASSTNGRREPSSGTSGGAWDQFAANERMYGLKTDYNEEIYTTRLDRSTKDYRDREARAAQLEREILKGTSSLASNAHMAEERGEHVDDDNVNEEDRYGAVQRNPGAYVPPGARKAALARLGGGGGATSPNPPPTNGISATSTTATSQAAPPASRIPPTVRIPSAQNASTSLGATAAGSVPAPTKSHPPVDETFRDFVREEKERLEKKKAALLQQQAKAEKDNRLRSLVQFSQSFKNPYPITDEIANMMHGKKPSPAADPVSAKASSTTVSPAAAPRQLPPAVSTDGNKLAPPSTSAQPPSAGKAPAPVQKKSLLLADIPPFNPAKAAARQAELAAQKAAKESGETGPSLASSATTTGSAVLPAVSTSSLAPQPPKSKISATAAPFVFKPNPNASTFTPGSSASTRKPSVANSSSPVVSPRPQAQAVPAASGSTSSTSPPNPFFGTKPLKRAGSSSLNVKEDFTPFRLNSVLPEPGQAVPTWPFTGKPYRSMYPPQATPLSLADEQAAYQNAIAAQQAAMSGVVGLDPSVSPAPQALMAPHHAHHPHQQPISIHPSVAGAGASPGPGGLLPPPPPGSQAAAMAMGMASGYPTMNVHHQQQMAMMAAAAAAAQQHQQGSGGPRQMYPQMASNAGGAGGSHQTRGGQGQQHMQHGHSHHQPQQSQMGFAPPPYHLQQAMGMQGGFPQGQPQQGGQMFTSPSMQPQPTPAPSGGAVGPPQPSPRYAPYHPYSSGANGPPQQAPPPGAVPPPQGFVQQ